MAAAPGVVGGNSGVNPLNLMQMFLQYRQQGRMLKQRQDENDRAERDRTIKYAEQFGRTLSEWDDVNNAIINDGGVLMNKTQQLLHEKKDPNDVTKAIYKDGMNLLATAQEMTNAKKNLEIMRGDINKGIDEGIFKPDVVRSKFNDIVRNPNGTIKLSQNPDGSTNWMELRNSLAKSPELFNDPSIYDEYGVVSKWVGGLKDWQNDYLSKFSNAPGRTPDLVREKIESGLEYMIDPKTNKIMVDDNMNPIPKIDDTWLKIARTDKNMKVVLDAFGGNTRESQMQYLKNMVVPQMDQPKIEKQLIQGHPIPEADRRYFAFGSGFRFPIADLEDRDKRLEEIVTKTRPDLLSGLHDPSSDLGAAYADKDGNPIKSGQKPESIILLHSGRMDGVDKNVAEQIAAIDDVFAKMALMQKAGIAIKPEVYPIKTDEEKRKAKIAMSLRLDKLDAKRSIGEEYSNYVEAKRKSQTSSIAAKMKEAAKK